MRFAPQTLGAPRTAGGASPSIFAGKGVKIDLNACARLPTLPTVAVQILATFENTETPIDSIVNIINGDPAIASKVLKAANAAQYATLRRVSDLKRAVLMLGKRSVTPLVLSFCLAQESMEKGRTARYYQDFWLNAFVRATAADLLSHFSDEPNLAGEASTVSLLSGIGRLALLRFHTDLSIECLEQAARQNRPICEVEAETIGFSHVDLSGAILRQLRLAEHAVTAVSSQLDPVEKLAAIEADDCRRLSLVVAAARATAQYLLEPHPAVPLVRLQECLDALGQTSTGAGEVLIKKVCRRLEAAQAMFDIDAARLPRPQVLLQQALDQLAHIATVAETDPESQRVPQQLLEENGRLKRRVADLIRQTTVDPLTGIYNRSHLMEVCREFVALSRLRKQAMGLLVVDIDCFKRVNDTYGHVAGDHILKEVAATLQATIRQQDVVGRYGGEEFVILVGNASLDCLESVAERVRSAVESLELASQGEQIPVTISVGGAFDTPGEEKSAFEERLYVQADKAMYQAKRAGRNRVVILTDCGDAAVSTPDGEPAVLEGCVRGNAP